MKKIILLLLTGVLGFSTLAAQEITQQDMAKINHALSNLMRERTYRTGETNGMDNKGDIYKALTDFDVSDYLRQLAYAVEEKEDVDWNDEQHTNTHELLMQANPKKYAEVAFYQILTRTFEKMYKTSPVEGTLDQYESFYHALKVNHEAVLSTIGIWSNNNLFAVVPFGENNNDNYYWEHPESVSFTYDIMGFSDEKLTFKMVSQSMLKQHVLPTNADSNLQDVKNFFAVWRNKSDSSLPSVKAAEKLEKLVIKTSKKMGK